MKIMKFFFDPHITQHGDSLAFIGQLSQLHHVSKMNLK